MIFDLDTPDMHVLLIREKTAVLQIMCVSFFQMVGVHCMVFLFLLYVTLKYINVET